MTEKCNSCEDMKKENKSIRKALLETNKNYVEAVNENLALHKQIEKLEKGVNPQIVFKKNVHEPPIITESSGPSQCEKGCCSSFPSNLDHPQIGAN